MFRVKICGITRPEDAEHALRCGADAIGLNFYPRSPRCVTTTAAAPIASAVAGGTLVVGVFVNESSARIAEIVAAVPLGAIQLHGDEPAEFVTGLPEGVPVIRAVRMGQAGLAPVADYAERCRQLGRPLAAVLVDAAPVAGQPEAYGGTGRTADWGRVAAERATLGDTPLILAGGLRRENVAEAIAATVADGVDTASGVESSPGVKDPDQVQGFVEAARQALLS